jgi:hypothetical protein
LPAPGPRPLPPALAQKLGSRTNLVIGGRTNQFPGFPRPGAKTNPAVQPPGAKPGPAPALPGLPGKTNPAAVTAAARPGAKTNAPAGARASVTSTNAPGGFWQQLRSIPQNRAFYPAVAAVALCLGIILLFRVAKSKKPEPPPVPVVPSKALVKAAKRKTNIQACNVLEVGPQARRLWQFDARGARFVLGRQQTSLEGEQLPSLVKKDWRSLFQPKLNIAWLPPENAFLRVAQLPRSDFNETLAMVELQLEKLSPIPVAQIVWSFQVLAHATGNLQTVIVLIVARNAVEEFLGKLEGQGYLADRLELPLLDQLQATAITEDGAWVYPEASGGKNTALVAWWYGGVLQNLDFLTLPATNRSAALKEQLMQMAWAGEMEGWLTAPPDWHLVADVAAPEWEAALREGLEQPVEVLAPVPPADLAAMTARRSAQADVRANLLPPEFTIRYQQQFVDRLWMRGLLGVGALYLVGLLVYFIGLGFRNYTTGKVEQQLAELGPAYTNALQLEARYQVLKDRQDLKYSALDCWNAAAHLLKVGTLDRLNFSEGKRLSLNGTAPSDAARDLIDFEAEMRRYSTRNGQPLFDANAGESLIQRVQGNSIIWSLGLVLKRTEAD